MRSYDIQNIFLDNLLRFGDYMYFIENSMFFPKHKTTFYYHLLDYSHQTIINLIDFEIPMYLIVFRINAPRCAF